MTIQLYSERFTVTKDGEELGEIFREDDGSYVVAIEECVNLGELKELVTVVENLEKEKNT